MVEIITEFRPVAVFLETEVTIECKIKGMAEHHVASWFHNEKVMTFGEEVIEYRHRRKTFQCATDGIHTYTIKMRAHRYLAGTYTMKVYERGPNETLDVVAQKDIAHLEIRDRYETVNQRIYAEVKINPLYHDFTALTFTGNFFSIERNTGGGVSIVSNQLLHNQQVVLGMEIEIKGAQVMGVDKSHIVCWCLNGKVLTRGEEVVEECQKHRLVPKIQGNRRVYYYTLTIKNAQLTDEGAYSLRVYEAGSALQNMLVASDITNVKILY